MTRDEAINRIAEMIVSYKQEDEDDTSFNFDDEDIEALDMGISALSAEGEYIKKEEAISKILIEFTKRERNEKFMCACVDVKQTCADILDSLTTYSIPPVATINVPEEKIQEFIHSKANVVSSEFSDSAIEKIRAEIEAKEKEVGFMDEASGGYNSAIFDVLAIIDKYIGGKSNEEE